MASETKNKLDLYRDEILDEYKLAFQPCLESKDILVVVHNQLEYVKDCFKSIFENTENYNLWVYDNGSDAETKDFLKSLSDHGSIHLIRNDKNLGFIKPNNILAKHAHFHGLNHYLILLNSDTLVIRGWDKVLINYLKEYPNVKQVGYRGSVLDENGLGGVAKYGSEADYICGWCFCISHQTYESYGLFDENNLLFAYGEDSDFSFRLRENGHDIYALHLDLVIHHGNKTVAEVRKGKEKELAEYFELNHSYIRSRWSKYLAAK